MTFPPITPDSVEASDIVIVGSGVAGLVAALRARARRITVVSKTGFAGGGSSPLAQGGVAVAIGPDDSPARHATDTIDVGCGLCDLEVVRRVTSEGPSRIADLMALGARFDRETSGRLELGREAAHSRRRVIHAAGDATGFELVRALAEAVEAVDGIRIVEHTMALEILRHDGNVVGVLTVDREGRVALEVASAVVLATGGVGQAYLNTTNPVESTGDGLAMAARAGARLAGLEFVQFHPTAMDVGSSPMPLLTEALRGEGAVLVDERGGRFMEGVHGLAELAPRDVVSRAIWRHRMAGHRTFLDATTLGERLASRFPTVMELCLAHGLDLQNEPIPVAPAAHYHMGGVVVDQYGRSSIPGLWACGEVAHTGLHGANRLASNSLLEAVIYGSRIGERLARSPLAAPDAEVARVAVRAAAMKVADQPWIEEAGVDRVVIRLRDEMWRRVGLERSEAGLVRAIEEIDLLAEDAPPGFGELGNLLTVAGLVARSARIRTESRGAHFRNDIPRQDHHWQQHLYIEAGKMCQPRPIAVAG